MAFSSNGEFGHILIDDSSFNQDQWYELGQIGSGLSATAEVNAISTNTTGQQKIYLGILPNGGTAPTGITTATLNDLRVLEFGALLTYQVPYVRNAIVLANQASLYVYADDADVDFQAFGLVRTEA